MKSAKEACDNRNSGLDVSKGLGILCIILSHVTTDGETLRYFLFAFHVPLFFLLSGYFFKADIKRVRYRMIKYLLAYIILSMLDIVILYFFNPRLLNVKIVVEGFLGLDSQMIFNSPKWFLLTLLGVQIIAMFILKMPRIKQVAWIIFFGIIGYVLQYPCRGCLCACFVAMIFFYSGYILKESKGLQTFMSFFSDKIKLFLAIFMLIIVWRLGKYNGMVSIQKLIYGRYVLFYINAYIGIFSVLFLGDVLAGSRILKFLGENTFVIFLTHYYLVRGIAPQIFPDLYNCFIGEIILVVATVIIYLPVLKVYTLLSYQFRNRRFAGYKK